MLHDLTSGNFFNEYKNEKAQITDYIFCFRDSEVMIGRDSEGIIRIPHINELNIDDVSALRYIFSFRDINCFLWTGDESKAESEYFSYESVRGMRERKSKDECFAIMTAWHLHSWYISNRFCGKCGNPTVHDSCERMLRCTSCSNMIFPKISPAVIVAVTDGDRIILSKYAYRNYNRFALIAGYNEIGETPEQTVCREVMEEVGLKVKNIRYYKSQPWGIDGNILMGFFCDLDGSDYIKLDYNELSHAGWYPRDSMPFEDEGKEPK